LPDGPAVRVGRPESDALLGEQRKRGWMFIRKRGVRGRHGASMSEAPHLRY
jgi:hypothetical protein